MKHALPKIIYIVREYDKNDKNASWLLASDNIDNVDDGSVVGIYGLDEVRKVKLTRELVGE